MFYIKEIPYWIFTKEFRVHSHFLTDTNGSFPEHKCSIQSPQKHCAAQNSSVPSTCCSVKQHPPVSWWSHN